MEAIVSALIRRGLTQNSVIRLCASVPVSNTKH
jgi:hypothetical protein